MSATPIRTSPEPAAIYVRVSDPKQERGTSPETQQAGALDYCQSRSYTVAPDAIYVEPAHSGADLWERPALQSLLAALRAGRFRHVVVYALDRISRDTDHQGYLFSECERVGAHLESVTEDLSDDTLQGRILRAVAGVVAEIEREKIRERTMRGRLARAKEGHLPRGGVTLYGYVILDDPAVAPTRRYLPDEEDGERSPAAIVRRIWAEYAAGFTPYAIARRLSLEGIPTRLDTLAGRGQLTAKYQAWLAKSHVTHAWWPTMIWLILKEPKYTGEALAFRDRETKVRAPGRDGEWKKVRKHSRRSADDPTVVTLPAEACPALVTDPAIIAAVRTRLGSARAQVASTKRQAPSATGALLARGLVLCGYCGGRMGPQPARQGRGATYYCIRAHHNPAICPGKGHAINVEKLDGLVWTAAQWLLTHPETLRERAARLIAAGTAEQDQHTAALAEVAQDLSLVKERRRKLLDRLERTADTGEAAEIEGRLDQLANQAQAAERRQATLAQQTATTSASLSRWSEWEQWAEREATRLTTEPARSDPAERRKLYQDLDLHATVWRQDHLGGRVQVTFFSKTPQVGQMGAAVMAFDLPPEQEARITAEPARMLTEVLGFTPVEEADPLGASFGLARPRS